jgi:hypothetical protein
MVIVYMRCPSTLGNKANWDYWIVPLTCKSLKFFTFFNVVCLLASQNSYSDSKKAKVICISYIYVIVMLIVAGSFVMYLYFLNM